MSFTIKVDMLGIDQMLDQLGDKAEEAARPAAQAAAQVFYDEVQRNVSRLGSKSGNLKRSIYQAFTFVRPEAKGKPKPKRKASQAVKDAYYVPRKGGPKQIPARPFVRPALAKSEASIEAAKAVLLKHMGL
jgi:hypothetical protein